MYQVKRALVYAPVIRITEYRKYSKRLPITVATNTKLTEFGLPIPEVTIF